MPFSMASTLGFLVTSLNLLDSLKDFLKLETKDCEISSDVRGASFMPKLNHLVGKNNLIRIPITNSNAPNAKQIKY